MISMPRAGLFRKKGLWPLCAEDCFRLMTRKLLPLANFPEDKGFFATLNVFTRLA
jgi:hypothetical protein